ncbi:TIGR02587 family membrane protein [Hansschlegelia sp. KR7-227]|uniref:TIGR02587 family membrane protein n=1 Tax=Hansschlegelia sp. KR7-227 TaxID=3400914 RepID=UPI003C0EB554
MSASAADRRREIDHGFALDLGRAAGGAIVFVLPVLMTMEMWQLGATLERWRIAVILAGVLPLLVGLSHYVGFEDTETWLDDVRDAFVAIAVGFVVSAAVLALFGLIEPQHSFDEALGAIVIQTVPASFGAVLAQGQLGQSDEKEKRRNRQAGYPGDLLFLAAGALFLSFNIAPTEEIDLIAASMGPYHAIALVLVSLIAMHAIVYLVRFAGQDARRPEGHGFWSLFVRYTLGGYAVALLVAAAMLWAFGRLDDLGPVATLRLVVTLGFPAAIGAAFARLIVGGGD